MYRYRRIGEARAAAREAGLRGAMFPWQSGSEGIEETQRVHLNPVSDRWRQPQPQPAACQRGDLLQHLHYYQATGDEAFLRDYGAEMMLEIARLWASIEYFNPERNRYEIRRRMGPDEFHDKYRTRRRAACATTRSTNVMVAWLCDVAGKPRSCSPRAARRSCASGWHRRR